jgi:Transposase DDE domain
MRMRDGNELVDQALSRQVRYQQIRDNLRVREVRLDATDQRFVICYNPDQAERDKASRDEAIIRIEAELARIRTQRQCDRTRKLSDRARGKAEAAHLRGECALRDHPTLGRWLRQQPNGRLTFDRAKVKAEQRLDGKYLLATSDPDLSAEDVALGYKNLLEAERGFRDLKSQLLLRPVFHRLEHRIRAHVLLCWLALLLTRVAERSCRQPGSGSTARPAACGRPPWPARPARSSRPPHCGPSSGPSTRHFPSTRHHASPRSTLPEHPHPPPQRRRHTTRSGRRMRKVGRGL